MKVFLADISDIKPEYAQLLDGFRRDRVRRFKFADDRKRCILAGLLIRHFFGSAEVLKNEYGKPFLADGRCFNISHSGKYVLIALGDSEIGCDIERLSCVDTVRMSKSVFTDNEINLLLSARDRLGVFFDLWTKKESLLKCMGEGFHRGAKSVDVHLDFYEENNKSYYLKTWNFSDYTVSVCSLRNDFPDFIEFIETEELL